MGKQGLCSLCGISFKNLNEHTCQLRYCSPRPAPYYRNVVSNYERKCQLVLEKYKVSITNKFHMIFGHVANYIEVKGLPLGRTSDQQVQLSSCTFCT